MMNFLLEAIGGLVAESAYEGPLVFLQYVVGIKSTDNDPPNHKAEADAIIAFLDRGLAAAVKNDRSAICAALESAPPAAVLTHGDSQSDIYALNFCVDKLTKMEQLVVTIISHRDEMLRDLPDGFLLAVETWLNAKGLTPRKCQCPEHLRGKSR